MNLKINETDYSPDFEIAKRYIDFSAELLRLSLVAITGIGSFIISELKDRCCCSESVNYLWFCLAIAFFVLTIATALAHRFYATDCLSYRIAYLRSEDQKQNRGFIKSLKQAEIFLIVAEWLFGIAIVLSVIAFCKFIYN